MDKGIDKLVNFLVGKGAKPGTPDSIGDTPLHKLCKNYQTDNKSLGRGVESLINADDSIIELTNHADKTALDCTVDSKQFVAAGKLLGRNASVCKKVYERVQTIKDDKNSKLTNSVYRQFSFNYENFKRNSPASGTKRLREEKHIQPVKNAKPKKQ